MLVSSLDGHNKFYGYQNSIFALGVYGCLDTFSRKALFLPLLPFFPLTSAFKLRARGYRKELFKVSE